MEVASIFMRVLGAIVDIVIISVLFTLVGYAIGMRPETGVGFSFQGVAGAIALGACLVYFIVPEALWGASPAKFMLGMRVVNEEDGGKIDWVRSIIRNLVRVVDGLPALYIVGFLIAVSSPKTQRLGDRIAKTIVVRI
jgi:uncharacterized RDD family membrane protein YckC